MSITKSSTMPCSLTPECSGCYLPHSRCSANILADTLKISPLYKQQDSERWNAAVFCYQEMMNNREQYLTSPPNSPVEFGSFGKLSLSGTSSVGSLSPMRDMCIMDPRISSDSLHLNYTSLLPSLSKVSSRNRSLHGTSPQSRGDESSLELEAIAAVHELSFAVQSISVSEMLPRTSELIFVNVTTIEGQPYCLELTLKGWRIASLRQDCMHGDFTRLELFTTYFDTLYSLMDSLSPGYRNRFSEKVAQKLRILQSGEEEVIAPSNSFSCIPKFEDVDRLFHIQSPSNSSFSYLDEEDPCVALQLQVP